MAPESPAAGRAHVIGYTDRLSAAPGVRVRARLSTSADSLTARLVRLVNGDDNPAGPGVDIRPIASALDGQVFPGRVQPIRNGSYVRVEPTATPAGDLLIWRAHVRPTLVPCQHDQVILAASADGGELVRIGVTAQGQPFLSVAGATAVGQAALIRNEWYELTLSVGWDGRPARLTLARSLGETVQLDLEHDPARPEALTLTFAAAEQNGLGSDFFNGRIEAPELLADDGAAVARWDFGPTGRLREIRNLAGEGFAARSFNFPLRGILGHAGAGAEVDPRLAPGSYQAIHFHDDDLDDAGWEDDIVFDVPDLPSAVYGLEVTDSAGAVDVLPFVVTPTPQNRRRALLVLPTFSYLAYSCEHVMADEGARAYLDEVGVDSVPYFGGNVHDAYLLAQGLRSLYDVHTDGTGYCFTSTQKPLPNVRPSHRWAAVGGGPTSPHQFSADLHLVKWLDQANYPVDVVTDEEVHHQGQALLARYDVVLTGSHPEYPTTAMLDAYEGYVRAGGRVMYLGGNGFYWVTSVDPDEQHTIEIRRSAGIRAWEPEAGEWHQTTTGELAGLWRYRGRAPQKVFGVGMAAQGFDGNRPYRLAIDAAHPVAGFVVAGLEATDGLIGNRPSLVNGHGAAGVEIDRADRALGTSPETVVVASATGFSRAYGLDPVEVCLPDGRYDGTTNPLVRSDLALVPYAGGGAVFSVGSIAWCGSLLVDGGENGVARLTANVLDRFLDDAPLI